MKIHEGEKERKFQCDLCKQKFLTRYFLTLHQKSHEKSFKCTLCRYSCATKFNLNQHINCHIAGEKFKCLSCRKLFDTQSQLTDHSVKVIKNPEICIRMGATKAGDKLPCQTCGKKN